MNTGSKVAGKAVALILVFVVATTVTHAIIGGANRGSGFSEQEEQSLVALRLALPNMVLTEDQVDSVIPEVFDCLEGIGLEAHYDLDYQSNGNVDVKDLELEEDSGQSLRADSAFCREDGAYIGVTASLPSTKYGHLDNVRINRDLENGTGDQLEKMIAQLTPEDIVNRDSHWVETSGIGDVSYGMEATIQGIGQTVEYDYFAFDFITGLASGTMIIMLPEGTETQEQALLLMREFEGNLSGAVDRAAPVSQP